MIFFFEVIKVTNVTAFAFRATMASQIPAGHMPVVLGEHFGEWMIAITVFGHAVREDDRSLRGLIFRPGLKEDLGVIETGEMSFVSLKHRPIFSPNYESVKADCSRETAISTDNALGD